MDKLIVKYHPQDDQLSKMLMAAVLETLRESTIYTLNFLWSGDKDTVMNKIVVEYQPFSGRQIAGQLMGTVMKVFEESDVDKLFISTGKNIYTYARCGGGSNGL